MAARSVDVPETHTAAASWHPEMADTRLGRQKLKQRKRNPQKNLLLNLWVLHFLWDFYFECEQVREVLGADKSLQCCDRSILISWGLYLYEYRKLSIQVPN